MPLPCLIVRSFYQTELTSEALSKFGSMMLATAVTLAVLYVIGFAAKKLTRVPSEERRVRIRMLTSNFTFLGMPLVETLFGAEGLFYYTIFTTLARVIYYGCPPYMLGSGAKTSVREFLKQMFCPTIVAVIIGFCDVFFKHPPPEAVDSIIEGLAATGTPFGMMLCGMSLAASSLREAFTRPSVIVLSLVHLLVCPAAVLAVCTLCGFEPSSRARRHLRGHAVRRPAADLRRKILRRRALRRLRQRPRLALDRALYSHAAAVDIHIHTHLTKGGKPCSATTTRFSFSTARQAPSS